jgi:hypothetical protein
VNFIDNLRVCPVDPDFLTSKRHLSNAKGGISQFTLKPGPSFAGDTYLILSGISGTWPGFSVSGIDVPLNPDAWTSIALTLVNTPLLQGFMGQIDASGEAKAKFDFPGTELPEVIGLPMHFCYVVLMNPGGPPVKAASHHTTLLFTP